MPTTVNPMDALKSFEPALKAGELEVGRGAVHPDLLVHIDHPMGKPRATYAKMQGESVGALAMLGPADPLNGLRVFQLGYAVPQHLRKRGLAKDIAQAAIDEFTAAMVREGIRSFYVEAVVGVKNIASQKVAARVIGGEPKAITDENSGEAALQYIRKIGGDEE